jgi:hypothetical protein
VDFSKLARLLTLLSRYKDEDNAKQKEKLFADNGMTSFFHEIRQWRRFIEIDTWNLIGHFPQK